MDRTLDEIDAKILTVLQENARTTQADIAKAVGLAPSAVLERIRKLEAKGARKQRLLWASTGTKNPAYSDVLYVETLIGPDTVATVPVETLKLFEDHGVVAQTLNTNTLSDARRVIDALAAGGIDFRDVTTTLEREGLEKFAKSFESLLGLIAQKRRSLAR